MYRIFIVEDDRGIAEAVCAQAALWGWDCRAAQDFRNILPEFADFSPHLVLLDIALPFYNGYHWCAEIRKLLKINTCLYACNVSKACQRPGDGNAGRIDFRRSFHEKPVCKFRTCQEADCKGFLNIIVHDHGNIRITSVIIPVYYHVVAANLRHSNMYPLVFQISAAMIHQIRRTGEQFRFQAAEIALAYCSRNLHGFRT